MKFTLPERMQAVLIEKSGGPPQVGQVPIPRPGPGQVLIRMAAAPINPSDLARLKDTYVSPIPYPFVPGIEGSGRVVAAGPGLIPKALLGKRVACAAAPGEGGTWAEYMITSAAQCFPLPKALSLEQGAMLIVNPLTALAFFDIVKRGSHMALINNAAAGALGKMILHLARGQGIPAIHIVRNPEQVDLLNSMGAQYVLNSRDPDFRGRVSALTQQLRATLVLDPVGGQQAQLLLDATPFGSTLLAYANLSGEPGSYTALSLISENKKIQGFYLANWLAGRGFLKTLQDIRKVRQFADSALQTKIQKRLPLPAVRQALELYQQGMTAGKVLLVADPQEVGTDL